jgi:hypothetical protein
MSNGVNAWCVVIPIAIFIFLVWFLSKKGAEIQAIQKEKMDKLDEELIKDDFVTTMKITPPVNSPACELRVDSNHKMLVFFDLNKPSYKKIPFSAIINCEIIQDNSTIANGGIGRAVVGGLIAGGAGAIVGANTRKIKNVVSDLHISITTSNIDDPLITIKVISGDVERNTQVYDSSIEYAEKVQATMMNIINQNQ